MKNKNLNWKLVLELIKKNKDIENIELEFDNEQILWKDAMLFGEKGFEIPDKYIDYDDENIDYSDIPAITQEDIDNGKIKWIYKAEVPMRKEINDWIISEKIDMNKLFAELVENFYKTMKNINKKDAI